MGDARETEKAPDAFRTISEVAEDLELPQHVLRFWESRFTQIKPVKRAGGRRFYRPEDVDLLRGIRHLLYTDGYTIKGAQRILKEQGVRFVQDFGVEREVAVMRSARPARAPAGEGVTFGGLLGLLPRRRSKAGGGGPDDALPELPSMAELPLPFPDREADRDLEAEGPVPPIALRQTPSAMRQAPPALHQTPPALRQPPLARPRREPPDERRRDPTFDALPPDPRGHREPGLEGERPAMRRAGPRAAAAGPRRIEPELVLQRPTRGPAARAAATARPALAPEMDDPLLPFLDDERAMPAGMSEPIEDRIRRLKAQERRPERELPFAGEAHHDSGPPEEYIPARARRDAAGPSAPHLGAPAPATAQARWEAEAPRTPAHRDRAEIPRDHIPHANVPRDGEWRQTDWVEASRDRLAAAEEGDDAQTFPDDAFPDDAFHDAAEPEAAPYREPPFHDARYPDPISRAPASHRRPHREVPRQMAEDAYSETRMVEQDRHRPPAAPVHAERRDPLTAAPAAAPRGAPTWPEADMRRAWGDSAPQALPRATRVGPLIAPIDEEETIPAILRRPDPEPAPEPPAPRRTAPWGQSEAGSEPAGPPRGPREPLRHGPPEQYLPPHLRSEPRVVGQAPVAAPVMSRDDVHRLQSALYELGECRRLMEGVLGGGDGGEPRDAG